MKTVLDDLPLLRGGRALSSARAVTLLVQGRGRRPEEMLVLAERLALPEMAFAAPTAAGGTWYPESFLAPLANNQPHLDLALDRLETIVRELEGQGFSRDRIALAGFSQGACLVAEYAYRTPTRWGALALLTGGVIGPEDVDHHPVGDLRGTPIFLGCSDVDAFVPLWRVSATAVLFRAMGGAVDLRVTAGMEHIVSDEQVAVTRDLLAPLVRA